ncbi:hypothetical protein D3C81_1872800 [compost metagenome]
MRTAPILDHRDRLADAPLRFEEPEQHDRIGDVGNVEVAGRHGADQPVLRIDQDGRHALLVEVGQHLVQLKHQLLFLGHRGDVAVEAIDHQQAAVALLDRTLHVPGELAR